MFRETSAKDLEDKIRTLEEKLDLILAKLDPNPEELLSTSEINMMKSWRSQTMDMEINSLKEYLEELYAKADAGESWANDEIESTLIKINKLEANEADNTPTGS